MLMMYSCLIAVAMKRFAEAATAMVVMCCVPISFLCEARTITAMRFAVKTTVNSRRYVVKMVCCRWRVHLPCFFGGNSGLISSTVPASSTLVEFFFNKSPDSLSNAEVSVAIVVDEFVEESCKNNVDTLDFAKTEVGL